MVELRKRPPKEPPAPLPAAKRGKAASSSSKVTKPATKKQSVTDKAKAAAAAVKEAVAGPSETDTADKQPTVEDETPVQEGQTGMIPETAGTAPSTTTVPAPATAGTTEASAASTAKLPPTQTPAEAKAGKKKAQALGLDKPTTMKQGEPAAADPLPTRVAGAGTATGTAAAPPVSTGPASAAPPPPTASSSAVPPPAPAAAATTAGTGEASNAAGDDRPPATEELENPPEKGKVEAATNVASVGIGGMSFETAVLPLSAASVGKQIPNITTFGGSVETHMGQKVSVAELLATAAQGGIIIFTYPRASTPGCTQQACAFRDNFDKFTSTSGYKIFGLSTDSTKANTTFATKQGLQYPLLCDPAAALTGALGMKKAGNVKGTLRGVVVIDSQGIVKVWFQGGPAKTVDVVKEYLATLKLAS